MPFQLIIRHNIESAQDHFGRADVRAYDTSPVQIGSSEQCGCRLDDDAVAPVHARIRAETERAATVEPVEQTGSTLFLNDEPLSEPRPLHSGDEIRIGHWTLRFRRLYRNPAHARRTDRLAVFAQVLLGLILVAEVGIVSWLPGRVASAQFVGKTAARQEAVMLLDRLRERCRDRRAADELRDSAFALVEDELDRVARYLHRYQETLSHAQIRAVRDDLLAYEGILTRLEEGKALPEAPPLRLEQAARALLREEEKDR